MEPNYHSQLFTPKKGQFFLVAGPCAIEDKGMAFEIASELKAITKKLKLPYVFKASYRKANRSSINSFTGIGDAKALEIIGAIRTQLNILTLTDIHKEEEAAMAAPFVDIIQIPAFLCRQTDLILAAARTGKIVNIKKGQFLSAEAMRFAIEKVRSVETSNVIVTERGNNFGYNDMIVDFRGIPIMKSFDVPVVLDVTHSVQKPNQSSGITGGNPEMIETLARAGVAVGADGIFLETHPNPSKAKSDGANMLPLSEVESLLKKLVKIKKSVV